MWTDRVEPTWGWPGSLLVLDGGDFGPELDDNRVVVGGDEALVVRAAPTQLTVLVGSGAGSGPIEVHGSGTVVAAPTDFGVLPFPDEWSVAETGPPEFFHGPQHGTPRLEQAGQPILALMTHALDTPRPLAAALAAERTSFDEAIRFWREASFGKTTFTLSTTDWLQLPRNRNEYVSDQLDIGWARSNLLNSAKRWTHVVGNRAYVAHLGIGLSIVDLTNRNQPIELGRISPGWLSYHVVVRGNLAYVAADTSGLVVVDIANSAAPVVRQNVGALGKVRGVDIDPGGTLLVAAARETGLHVFDLTNPLIPVLRATVPVGDEWATCVKLVGSRAFVGTGNRIRVYDLANPAAPVLVDAKDAGGWVMGLDADAGACAAATDGNGLAVFTVAAGTLTAAGTERGVLRLHGVRLLGRTACCAGADKGVHLVDLSNPAVPVALATVATARPCYDVAPDGPWALLGLGARTVAPIGLADPRTPQLGGELHLFATPPFGVDVDIAALRTNLANVTNNHGKLKTERLYVDALRAAAALGLDVNAPVGIVVVIAGSAGRGASHTTNKVGVPGDEWTFPDTKGVIWLAGGAYWGRRAHEIGHWFAMPDIYEEWFDDGRFLAGTAAPWCMAGNHDGGPLFSAREAIRMKLFKPENIAFLKWNPAGGPTVDTFDLVAHDLGEDASGRIHLLQLEVAAGLSYFVEVRQKPGPVIFDKTLPVTRVDDGLVVVTRCQEGPSISNTYERPTMLFGIAGVGESVVDAARLLRIEVEAHLAARPLAFRVKVHWNEEPPPDPNGKFDLRISPWNTDTWESPDIWVNSPRNDAGSPRYEFHEPGNDTLPILSGDKPWVQRPNTLFARVRNTGVQDVADVYVTAYTTTPPGIGDNGNWRTLDTKQVATIAANGEALVEFAWSPEVDKHTCLSVAVMPKAGEIEPRNNRGQENVARFDSPGSSSHEPAILEAEVRSPFSEWRKVDLEVRGLPDGWHAVVDRAWVWVPPKGAVPVTAVIWTDVDSPRDERQELPREAFPSIEGWTDFDHRYLPIGGILAPVRANRRTRIVTEWSAGQGVITVYGWLIPKIAGVPATLEITDPVGAVQLWPMGDTDVEGQVVINVPADPGTYRVQVFTASTPEAAEAESEPWIVEVG